MSSIMGSTGVASLSALKDRNFLFTGHVAALFAEIDVDNKGFITLQAGKSDPCLHGWEGVF